MEDILEILSVALVIGGVCIALPLIIVWLTNKRKSHEIDKKTEILMALLDDRLYLHINRNSPLLHPSV